MYVIMTMLRRLGQSIPVLGVLMVLDLALFEYDGMSEMKGDNKMLRSMSSRSETRSEWSSSPYPTEVRYPDKPVTVAVHLWYQIKRSEHLLQQTTIPDD